MNANRFKLLAVVLSVAMATAAFSQTVVKTAQGMGHHGGFSARMLGFYTDYLDLTDAQQAQMKDILTQGKAHHSSADAATGAGPPTDENARTGWHLRRSQGARAASQQTQAMTEMMVQKARIKSELMAVLTADQKDKTGEVRGAAPGQVPEAFPTEPGSSEPDSSERIVLGEESGTGLLLVPFHSFARQLPLSSRVYPGTATAIPGNSD